MRKSQMGAPRPLKGLKTERRATAAFIMATMVLFKLLRGPKAVSKARPPSRLPTLPAEVRTDGRLPRLFYQAPA